MMPLTPSVKVAKVWLREQGEHGRLLAGRLGRLSRRRNGAAHPDGALQRDIRALDIAVVSGELSSTPSSGGASHAGLGLAGLDDFPALVDEECEKDSDLPEQAKDSVVLVREVTDTTPLVEQSTKTIHEEVRPELAEKDITTGKDPSEVPDEPGKQQQLQFRDQACDHEALQQTARGLQFECEPTPGVAVARCSGTTSFSGSICAPRRSGPRRRASASQVECAMRAAGEQVPRLVCSLASDLQLGRRMLSRLISDLVAAHVPAALRRDFSAQALTAAQTPSDVQFFLRQWVSSFLLHLHSPGEESSELEDTLSDIEGSDDGNVLPLEPHGTDRYRFP